MAKINFARPLMEKTSQVFQLSDPYTSPHASAFIASCWLVGNPGLEKREEQTKSRRASSAKHPVCSFS